MKYGLPTFTRNGNLVHFGAFADELAGYARAKGSVQFPHDAPLPMDLIRRIVAYRIEENRKKKRR